MAQIFGSKGDLQRRPVVDGSDERERMCKGRERLRRG